jgi:hypothetical protein
MILLWEPQLRDLFIIVFVLLLMFGSYRLTEPSK